MPYPNFRPRHTTHDSVVPYSQLLSDILEGYQPDADPGFYDRYGMEEPPFEGGGMLRSFGNWLVGRDEVNPLPRRRAALAQAAQDIQSKIFEHQLRMREKPQEFLIPPDMLTERSPVEHGIEPTWEPEPALEPGLGVTGATTGEPGMREFQRGGELRPRSFQSFLTEASRRGMALPPARLHEIQQGLTPPKGEEMVTPEDIQYAGIEPPPGGKPVSKDVFKAKVEMTKFEGSEEGRNRRHEQDLDSKATRLERVAQMRTANIEDVYKHKKELLELQLDWRDDEREDKQTFDTFKTLLKEGDRQAIVGFQQSEAWRRLQASLASKAEHTRAAKDALKFHTADRQDINSAISHALALSGQPPIMGPDGKLSMEAMLSAGMKDPVQFGKHLRAMSETLPTSQTAKKYLMDLATRYEGWGNKGPAASPAAPAAPAAPASKAPAATEPYDINGLEERLRKKHILK